MEQTALDQQRVIHDLLLACQPPGANHDQSVCPVCVAAANPEGHVKTYTEDEVKAKVDEAVAAATAELATKVDELTRAGKDTEIATAIAEATEPLETKLADAQAQLDVAVAERDASKAEFDTFKADLAAIDADREREAEKETRKAERVQQVTAAASYSEEYVAANADRWADMDDDAFATFIDSLKAVAKPPVVDPVVRSALTASAGEGRGTAAVSTDLAKVLTLREQGINVRSV